MSTCWCERPARTRGSLQQLGLPRMKLFSQTQRTTSLLEGSLHTAPDFANLPAGPPTQVRAQGGFESGAADLRSARRRDIKAVLVSLCLAPPATACALLPSLLTLY